LTSGSMSNPLPSDEQYGAQTVKASDERKNDQSTTIRGEILGANRGESR